MQDNHKSLIDVHVRRKTSFDDLAHNDRNAQVSHEIMMMDKKRKKMLSAYKEQAQFDSTVAALWRPRLKFPYEMKADMVQGLIY